MDTRSRRVEAVFDQKVGMDDVRVDPLQHASKTGEPISRAVYQAKQPARQTRFYRADGARWPRPECRRRGRAALAERVHRSAGDRLRWPVEADRVHVVPAIDEIAQPNPRVRALEVGE